MMPWTESGPSLEGDCIAHLLSPCVYVCVFMCVCMREGEREGERERERRLGQCFSVYFFPSTHHVGLVSCLQDTPVSRRHESQLGCCDPSFL